MALKLNWAVVTISDTCSSGINVDKSGPALKVLLEKNYPGVIVNYKIIPDDFEVIKNHLIQTADRDKAELILTTGGTGFSIRDVTPEATKSVIHREANGISMAMCIKSLESTQFAMLSRSVCGIRNNTLIINLPGSVKAATECFGYIQPVLSHALQLIKNDVDEVKKTHQKLQGDVLTHQESHKTNVAVHNCCKSKLDISSVATRLRESPYPMIEVSDAIDIIFKSLHSYERQVEICTFENILGKVLAEDIVSPENFPPFAASIKDGYACLSSDGVKARDVIDAVIAGDNPQVVLTPGKCARINTGAPIPSGADCVVQVEDTQLLESSADGKRELRIMVNCNPKPGQDIRPIGSDIKQNDLLLTKGTVIGPAEVGLLATVGLNVFRVYEKPSVSLLSTGNELKNANDSQLNPGHIRDSNKPMLNSLFRELGVNCIDVGIAIDDPNAMNTAFNTAFRSSNFIITTGSVSMGDRDIVKPILIQDFKATVHFGRLNMKPGKPSTFATCLFEGNTKYIFALPGNPVSALVTCQLLVVPALKSCMGMTKCLWNAMQVTLKESLVLDSRPEYVRAIVQFPSDGQGVPIAVPTGHQISSRLLSAAGAPLLLRLPSNQGKKTEISAGSPLTALIVGKIN